MTSQKFNVQEIAAWLKEIRDASGFIGVHLTIHTGENPAYAMAWDGVKHYNASADTFEEALNLLRERMGPMYRARELRAQAAELEREAAAMEAAL